MRTFEPYDETYPTCAYTHAWLRIMSEDLDPDKVTDLLKISPTEIQRVGDPVPSKPGKYYSKSGWFLTTVGHITSLDARHHLDWILERVADKQREFDFLLSLGYLRDMCCRWDSKSGHGGPTLSPQQMKILTELNIELWFDIYFDEPTE